MKSLLTVLSCWLLLVPAALSAEAEPALTRENSAARDLETQIRARQLLMADEELAPFNLGVTVQNGVAVVWGPVSAPALKAKALKKIEDVRGVFQVQSQIYLSTSAGMWSPPSSPLLLPDAPQHTSSASPDWRTGKLPTFPGQLASKKISDPSGPPKPATLLAPIALSDEGTNGDPVSAIERIRNGDERYRLVQYEMKDGAIYLRGTAKPENVMAFARAISNIPGVERVVLQKR